MNQKKIDRINELARKSRDCGLNDDELCEQKALRDEFRRDFIGNLTGQLENITLVMPDGEKIPVKDLKKDDEKKG